MRAALLSGVDRDNHYLWMKKDPEYALAFEEAWSRGLDVLEAEIHRRAFIGVRKPVFHAGKRALDFELDEAGNPKLDAHGKPIAVPAVIIEFSDTLAMFTLNGERPHKYRQRSSVESRFVDSKGADRSLDALDDAIARIEAREAKPE